MRWRSGIADEQAARLAPDLGEALAAFADGWSVDDGQQFFSVVRDERVEQGFIAVLKIAHEGVFREGTGLVVESLLAAFALVFERADVRRKQAVQGECGALLFGECGALVEFGVEQQVVAGKMSADYGGVGRGGGLGGHAFFSSEQISALKRS